MTVESVPGGERGDARGVDVGMEEKVGRKLIHKCKTEREREKERESVSVRARVSNILN